MDRSSLVGNKYGRLTVTRLVGRDKHGNALWECVCDCGNVKKNPTRGFDLKSGITTSCGCEFRESEYYKRIHHGQSGQRIYREYNTMKMRCFRKKWPGYGDYGGRGITVCDEWKNSFRKFYDWAMENGYSDSLSLDRIDVNGNYQPSNCRWVSMSEQARNKRNTMRVEIDGVTKTVLEWSEESGINYQTIRTRIRRGVTGKKLLSRPFEVSKNADS